jgi:tetratricopeptide (TPR) repeat protein
MKIAVIHFILTIILCFNAENVCGQANNSIAGFIFGPQRNAVSDMQVELLDDLGRLIARSKTDAAGRYFFSRLPRGRFMVRVVTVGTNYQEQTIEVEIASISRGGVSGAGLDTVQQNFYLRAKRNPAGKEERNEAVFVQDVPEAAQKLCEKARDDIKEKKADAGIAGLKAAIEIFPEYYLALKRLGEEYIDLQKYGEARDVLVRAIRVNHRDHESQYALGYALFQLKDYGAAVVALRNSIELNPNSINGQFLLGVSLKHDGQYEAALLSLQKAKKLAKPPRPEIHWQLSLLYTNNLKDYAAAADELELYLKATSNHDDDNKIRELIKKLRLSATERP